MATKGKDTKANGKEIKNAGMRARWGEKRGPSSLIRVDKAVADIFRRDVKERDRRQLASSWLYSGVEFYNQVKR